MILAFSTSSPWASVGILEDDGRVVWSAIEHAPRSASGTSLRLLQQGLNETGSALGDFGVFAADVGPGSFTGVRVGVVMAKTLAWNGGGLCAGADAFDLIDPLETVALPSKKGEFFVRIPGYEPVRQPDAPAGAVGFGFSEAERPPSAERFGVLVGSMRMIPPEQLMPRYLIEASISQPKKPLSRRS